MKKVIVSIIFLLFVNSVFASDYFRERTIIGAGVYASGDKSILFVHVNGDKSSMASCASSQRFAIDSTSPNFKEMVSIALTAYATKEKTVELVTTPTCKSWGNAQDLLGIKIGSMPW
ncbi:hypothetical protein [Pseudoalteromonas luteoviolacea]|uniref:Uncharacterized protein n=1 Tax=Pseudoalteromonas luteoviolacea S4060-1 TaxID=1365257 RepID=A0A167JMV2_9GAMM|nr:hypothetical protein [Pseudoalteromonas luteoviolacea]KZN61379.1 hypothetical protein N478_04745 [Pseudoalteromonas luteoviolacea S4060-1]